MVLFTSANIRYIWGSLSFVVLCEYLLFCLSVFVVIFLWVFVVFCGFLLFCVGVIVFLVFNVCVGIYCSM